MTDSQTPKLGAIVLCGGQSRRMGAPKEWLDVGGEPMLSRVVRIVAQVAEPVIVVGKKDQPLPPLAEGVEVIHDAIDDIGPLAGMAAGLDHLGDRCPAALVLSCDHPMIQPAFLRRLAELLTHHPAVVPADGDLLYPLVGIYRKEVRIVVQDMITACDLRVQHLPIRFGARIIPADQFRRVDPDLSSLINVNDQDSFMQALAAAAHPRSPLM